MHESSRMRALDDVRIQPCAPARRSACALGSWVSSVMARRAGALGFSVSWTSTETFSDFKSIPLPPVAQVRGREACRLRHLLHCTVGSLYPGSTASSCGWWWAERAESSATRERRHTARVVRTRTVAQQQLDLAATFCCWVQQEGE